MKICFIVDARSPIARNWINHFARDDYEIHIISTRPCTLEGLPAKSLHIVPLGLSHVITGPTSVRPSSTEGDTSLGRRMRARLNNPILLRGSLYVRNLIVAIEIYRHIAQVRCLVNQIHPDLVHAMRIPFEGMLASLAVEDTPLLISVWGNDFTLHAKSNMLMGKLTRLAMRRTNALHSDCERDEHLARSWGFQGQELSIVLPSNGGIRSTVFSSSSITNTDSSFLSIPADHQVILNPRGFRPYVRNDVFFKAIPLVLSQRSKVIFLCSAMQDQMVAQHWVRRLGIEESVRLLPVVPHDEMASFFRIAQIAVSPSVHDGTPNTLLEAMACGCFPLAGDIESIREWIFHGENGLLFDPTDPASLAAEIIRALEDHPLRRRAREYNANLVAERADYQKVMYQAAMFYRRIVATIDSRETTSNAVRVGNFIL